MIDQRYPIGKYEILPFSETTKNKWLLAIQQLPTDLEMVIQNLDKNQLDTPYRAGGWTVHQLVHHVADSHMNAFIRFKLALTESLPMIKTYEQDAWVNTADALEVPINVSITLLHALHIRWASLISSISEADWNLCLYHPEREKEVSLWEMFAIYSWHGRHHVAHINNLRIEKGW